MSRDRPPAPSSSEKARRFVATLAREGVTHLVTVPDNTSAAILQAMEDREVGPSPRVLYVTREGEAMGLAAGLWLGGASPALLIQNTGLLEAGDGLRGTLARMGAPAVLFVTCRGYERARKAGADPTTGIQDRGMLVRQDLDSVAHMTESTLRAWGIPFHYLRDSSDSVVVGKAFAHARKDGRPVAVLIDASFQ